MMAGAARAGRAGRSRPEPGKPAGRSSRINAVRTVCQAQVVYPPEGRQRRSRRSSSCSIRPCLGKPHRPRRQSRHLHLPKSRRRRDAAQALDDGPALVERVITRLGMNLSRCPERVSTAAEVRDPQRDGLDHAGRPGRDRRCAGQAAGLRLQVGRRHEHSSRRQAEGPTSTGPGKNPFRTWVL